jgi:putative transposase
MDKFKGQYRTISMRLPSWDYGNDGFYFITICTQNKRHDFGKIVDENIELSEIGRLAEQFWLEIPNHFSFVQLDAFVIMPNHIHGILIIDKSADIGEINSDGDKNTTKVETPNLGVSTAENVSSDKNRQQTVAASKKWKPATLGVIINQYKRMVTLKSRKINPTFAWQSRFYDHIIRDENGYYNIQNYILYNPQKWEDDRFYKTNL